MKRGKEGVVEIGRNQVGVDAKEEADEIVGGGGLRPQPQQVRRRRQSKQQ